MTSVDCLNHKFLPSLPLPSSFDMNRVLKGVNTYLNPARDSFQLKYQVLNAQDGKVGVYFELPEGMLNCFVNFLQSMASFFQVVTVKEKSVAAQQRSIDLNEQQRVKQFKEELCKAVCDKFDKCIKDGFTTKDAISITNRSLKTGKFPNLSYETVKSVLRKSGRFRSDRTN